jgi:AcrR family transcriptional regulator
MAPPDDRGRAAPEQLRSDAERNRDRIVDAARRLYAAEGLGVSMAAVARAAGVGIATLFRRFPARDDLIAAVFADRMSVYGDAITAALADPDPWRGFAGYVEAVCAMQAADRGFAEVLTMTFPTAKALEECRDQAYQRFVELIARAKAAGRLRQDFTPEDMPLLLMANAGVIAATGDAAPDAWRRLVGYLIQAFAVPEPAPLPPAPSPAAMYRAMITVHRTRNR